MNESIKNTVEEVLKAKGNRYTFDTAFNEVCKEIEDANDQFHSYHIDWDGGRIVFNESNLSECLAKIKTDLLMKEEVAYAKDVIELNAESFEERMKERLDECLNSKGISDRYSDDIFLDFCDHLYDRLTKNFDRDTGEILSVLYTEKELDTLVNDFFARIPKIEQDDKRTLFKFNIPTHLSDMGMDALIQVYVCDPVDKEKEHPRMWAQMLTDLKGISVRRSDGYLRRLANDEKNTAYEKTLTSISSFPTLCRGLQEYVEEMPRTVEELYKKIATHEEGFHFKGVYIEPYIEDRHLDYILVHDNDLCGSDSIYEVAENLIYLNQIRNRNNDYREQFEKNYREELITSEYMKSSDMDDNLSAKWDGFSDYHKDLYGYRPHSDERNVPLQNFLSSEKDGHKYLAYVKSENEKGRVADKFEEWHKRYLKRQEALGER